MFLVVACHCFGNTSTASSATISLLTYLEMPCIGLFIALSGALLLPVRLPSRQFIKRRLNKILFPTIIWSLIYLFIRDGVDANSVRQVVGGIFCPVGSGILWFMYTILGLYIISPVISPWLENASKRNIQFYLLIWGVTLVYPIIGNWIEINETPSGWTYYFAGYIGYFILGYYLRKYGLSLKISAVLWIVLFLFMIVSRRRFPQLALYTEGCWYLTIFSAVSVVFYWLLIKYVVTNYIKDRLHVSIVLISNLMFGVYFVHIGLVSYITPEINFNEFSFLPNYLIRVAVTFIIAIFISWLISILPFAEYFIGYRQNRNQSRYDS